MVNNLLTDAQYEILQNLLKEIKGDKKIATITIIADCEDGEPGKCTIASNVSPRLIAFILMLTIAQLEPHLNLEDEDKSNLH